MSILKQIQLTIANIVAGDTEQALKEISIAISATSENEYPTIKPDGAKYKKFLQDNMFLITKVGLGFCIQNENKFELPNVFNSLKRLEKFKDRTHLSLGEIMYHVVRCKLLHEAELPVSIYFTDKPILRCKPTKITIPKSLICGLLLSVIVAKTNINNKLDGNIEINIIDRTIQLNKIWGNKELLLELLK